MHGKRKMPKLQWHLFFDHQEKGDVIGLHY